MRGLGPLARRQLEQGNDLAPVQFRLGRGANQGSVR